MAKKKQPEYRTVDLETNDPRWSLQDWAKFIEQLIGEYGPDATLYLDAGANDVALLLQVPLTKPEEFETFFVKGSSEECWEWIPCDGENKYGRCYGERAHRFSYRAYVGAILPGLHVLQSCGNQSCVNPAHLFLGNTEVVVNPPVTQQTPRLVTVREPNIIRDPAMGPYKKSTVRGFEAKFIKGGADECWLWLPCKGKYVYGEFNWNSSMSEAAHRCSFRIYVKQIPEDLLVLHTCDNPPCVNPNHLFLGTHRDNVRDMVEKGRDKLFGRSGPSNCKVLTEEDMDHMKWWFSQFRLGRSNVKLLADEYDIPEARVLKILEGSNSVAAVERHVKRMKERKDLKKRRKKS